MVKISSQTLRTHKTNREILTAMLILLCVLIVLICSGVLYLFNVKTTSVTPTKDFHYLVTVGDQLFDIVPDDVLRIERTPAKKAITGQEIELLKVYTDKGFIYAKPDDVYYDGVKKLVNATDWYSQQIYIKGQGTTNEVGLQEVRKFGYAIGTPEQQRPIIFGILGLQNLAMFVAGLGVVMLIFPLRLEKECETARVVTRMEQPA